MKHKEERTMSTQEYINSENINIALEYTILSYHIFHAGEHERGRKSGNNLFTKTKRIWFSEKCRILYDTIKQCYDKNNYEYMNITHTFMELYPNKEQLLTDVLISNDLQTNVNIDILRKTSKTLSFKLTKINSYTVASCNK